MAVARPRWGIVALLALAFCGADARADDAAPSVRLTPSQQTATIPAAACIDAHVTDAAGAPLARTVLFLDITGGPPNPRRALTVQVPATGGNVPITDANGNSRFCLSAPDPSLRGDYSVSAPRVWLPDNSQPAARTDTVGVTFRIELPPPPQPTPAPVPLPPLVVGITLDPAAPHVGDLVTLVATVRNNAGRALSDVKFEVEGVLRLAAFRNMSLTASAGECSASTVTCTAPSLGQDATLTMTLVGRAATTVPAGLTALVTVGPPGGASRMNGSAGVTMTAAPARADLGVTLVREAPTSKRKDVSRLRVHVSNGGSDTALGVALQLRAASGIVVMGCDGAPCRYPVAVGDLGPGASTDVVVTVRTTRRSARSLTVSLAPNTNVVDEAAANDTATVMITRRRLR